MKILVVDDNLKMRENISKFLKISGFTAETASDGKQALEKMIGNNYDLIILDINMPFLNGKDFTKTIRKTNLKLPIIALTSNSMLDDKLEMFELGVDDYMTKPFELKELLARVYSLLKRKENIIENEIILGDIIINQNKHKVFFKGIDVELLNKEFLIVEFLAINKGYPKNKTQILEKVWGESETNLEFSSTTLEAHISNIRKKLGKDFIKTIKGVGYIIE